MAEQIFADFTEDKAISQPIQCGRTDCGRMINPGDPRHNIRNHNPNRPSKVVCADCREFYLVQPTTGASRSEHRVTAVSDSPAFQEGKTYHRMMPPPFGQSGIFNFPYHSPNCLSQAIHIPNSWNAPMSFPPPSSQWAGSSGQVYTGGYSENHAHYGSQRAAWASKAYQSGSPETIGIIMQVLREIPGKFRGQIVENLVEGKQNIPATITAPNLIASVVETMRPKLASAMKGFEFGLHLPKVREVAGWVDLSEENQHQPYFYERCLVNPSSKAKDKGRVFKKPRSPFILAIVIGSDQWDNYLDFSQAEEEGQNGAASFRSRNRGAVPSGQQTASSAGGRTLKLSNASWEDPLQNDNPDNWTDPNHFPLEKRPRTVGALFLLGSIFWLELDLPGTSFHSTTFQKTQYSSILVTGPDQTTPGAGYWWGIADDPTGLQPSTSERIEFFALTDCALKDLLQPPTPGGMQFFVCNPQHAAPGSLSVEFSDNIGVGTFKTTHVGHLTLIHLRTEGLGTIPNHPVAVKRMYRRRSKNTDSNSSAVTRYSYADEYALTVQEANLLYWASSLMGFTYSFINHFIANTPVEPPFNIPQLCFVHAGVAVVHDQVSGTNVANVSSIHRTYLLEELIDTENEDFVKFIPFYLPAIHFTKLRNFCASPSTYNISRLTEHREIAGGNNIFGEGNIGKVFKEFPEQHACNDYCEWFKLPSMADPTLYP
ncbi:hypothetical protein DFH07DRAFT_983119 [Mycena maculata]|uniref:Alpha-type protein kinase domain-containing protein n=1 Tax=Mycena maculata TaxID=230809 RepID=A0AAD7K0V3_9AGAR|nr:hypothetical protein DFH07DRAFT_983119 [Mycena maculata]